MKSIQEYFDAHPEREREAQNLVQRERILRAYFETVMTGEGLLQEQASQFILQHVGGYVRDRADYGPRVEHKYFPVRDP